MPLQFPDAVQLVAFAVVQVRVEALPDCTLVGDAVRFTVGAGATATVAVRDKDPPGPEQFNVKLVLDDRAEVACEPVVGLAPDQPPAAVQLVTFVELQVNVDVPWAAIVAGEAFNVSVGAGGDATVTARVRVTVPALPVQASVYDVLEVSGPTVALPEVAFAPDQSPLALQSVAFVALQLSVALALYGTFEGVAENDSVGAGSDCSATLTLADPVPPGPWQVNTKADAVVSGPTLSDPVVGRSPLQPPDAEQLAAPLADQDNVTL